MKNILLYPLFLILSSTSFAQVENEINIRKDVIDYYWEMSSSELDLIHYPIELKNKKWLTVSHADYEIEADVDYRKDYIFIKDPGNGAEDKASTYQFVLYDRKKGDPLIAISKKKFINEKWVTEVSFWKKKGGLWTNIVAEVAPELSYQDFLEGGREQHKLDRTLAGLLPIYYNLPKKGKSIKVFLLSEGLTAYCMNENPDDTHCPIRQFIKFQIAELRWNKGKSTFSVNKFQK
jgi:hypothetical protein